MGGDQALICITIILNYLLTFRERCLVGSWIYEFTVQERAVGSGHVLKVIHVCVAFRAIRLDED